MKIIIIVMLFIAGISCDESNRPKCVFEVYQNGTILEETCDYCYYTSYAYEGVYYKKTIKRCK